MKEPKTPNRKSIPANRRVYCNRTLNLRSIKAIGYDLDYTLVHYCVDSWERTTFRYLQEKLLNRGYPVDRFEFSPHDFQIGLIIDRQRGNILKADQFGYVKWGTHGTRMLEYSSLRTIYSDTVIELPDPRFVFLNTLFSLSEASMYAQLVDVLDAGDIPGTHGYGDLYSELKKNLDETHMEGMVKHEIASFPDRYIVQDSETPTTLLHQKLSGKQLLLITNSDWIHTQLVMEHAFQPHLPPDMPWRSLFDVIIVSARKPAFFTHNSPAFEVIDDSGILKPIVKQPGTGKILLGGSVELIEEMLGLRGSQILYVGDHAFGDVHVSKNLRRWRTALIIRELEDELAVLASFASQQEQLNKLMQRKIELEHIFARTQLMQHSDPSDNQMNGISVSSLREMGIDDIRESIRRLDDNIRPLALKAGELHNKKWGLLMRCGNDKSYLARLVEQHADIYTSRVSNLLFETPYAYFRASRGFLPHERKEYVSNNAGRDPDTENCINCEEKTP